MKTKFPYSILLIFTLLVVANVAQASDINQGRDIYQRHCARCHGVNGSASMAGAAEFKRGQGLMQSDHALLERIQNGKNACPAYRGILTKQQTFDVIAFIRTLF
jgi:mono/diheme cytochrome c family protein